MRTSHRSTALVLALTLVPLLAVGAACGTTEDPPERSAPSTTVAPDGTGTTTKTSTGPVTLTDDRGETVTLDAPARRVVALEWMQVENLVTLGVMPVGVADVENYRLYDTAGPLDDTVTDVGTRTEPSENAILDLEPDLIILEADRSSDLPDRLGRYAPVMVVQGADGEDNLANMRHAFELIATAVGKEDRAAEVLDAFDARVAEAKEQIDATDPENRRFMIVDGYLQGSSLVIRAFTRASQLSRVAESIGLENAWTGEGDDWGLDHTDIEGLADLPDLRFFYGVPGDDDPVADGSLSNPIWENLPFVRNGHVTRVEPGLWVFGGPASMTMLVDQLVAAYGADG